MPVQIFNRLFNGNNVALALTVDAVKHARQRRRLSAPGRACDKDHALCQVRKGHDRVGDADLPAIRQRKGYDADHGRQRPPLFEGVDAKARKTRHGKGKIVVARCKKRLHRPPAGRVIDLRDELRRIVRQKAFSLAEDVLADLIRHREAADDENIGSPAPNGLL